MSDLLKKENGLVLAVGTVLGLAIPYIAKAEKTRELLVKGTAKCLIAKDIIVEEATSIKEEAEDIYAEAIMEAYTEGEEEECCCCGGHGHGHEEAEVEEAEEKTEE